MKLFASLRPGSVRKSFRFAFPVFLLTLFFAPSLFAQLWWGPDQRLTETSGISATSGNNARCVAATGDTIHIVWREGPQGSEEIYYNRSLDGGLNWDWGFVGHRLTNYSGSSAGPSIAVSGLNVHVVWFDDRDGNKEIYYNRSQDGGFTWDWGDVGYRLTNNTASSESPSLAVWGSFVHVVWHDTRDGQEEIYYKRSSNGGTTWAPDKRLTDDDNYTSWYASVAASGSTVHVVWDDRRDGNPEIYYKRDTDNGASWTEPDQRLTTDGSNSWYPCVGVLGSRVHVVWMQYVSDPQYAFDIYHIRSLNNGEPLSWEPGYSLTPSNGASDWCPSVAVSGSNVHVAWYYEVSDEIYYVRSTDGGSNWLNLERLTSDGFYSGSPSVAASGTRAHVLWSETRDGVWEVYYKNHPAANGFRSCLTDSSNGRHLVRDPTRVVLHLVMGSQDNKIYYSRTTDNGNTWDFPQYLGDGMYPSVGLAVLPEDIYPPFIAVCVSYRGTNGHLMYQYNDGVSDPGTGTWHSYDISSSDPGASSLTAFGGTQVFVAYKSGSQLVCQNFPYDRSSSPVTEPLDNSANVGQPSLSVDAAGIDVYATWQRGTEIYYAPRDLINNPPPWSQKTRINNLGVPSQQPFIECYGESVFVVRSEDPSGPENSDVWRAGENLNNPGTWPDVRVIQTGGSPSESPTQAWREFTTWSEGDLSFQPDIWYWSSKVNSGHVVNNFYTWSYWPHSQMAYWQDFTGADIWSAWTECTSANQPPYNVLWKYRSFLFPPPPPPPGGGDAGAGSYYSVQAGQDQPSSYCRKRDGVLKFKDKAVDFARDSLVYELLYLDPLYDYFVRVSSYREIGRNWAEDITADGHTLRTVQFAPNKVDTVWLKIPYELYQRDRKVTLVAKKVKGDYVTRLGMTLYQADPKRRGKGGGPQSREPVSLPAREVFAIYPNPMNSQAQIDYSLKVPGQVNLSVYDVTGRLVREVVSGRQPAGMHKATWDGRGQDGLKAPSGIYFLRLSSPERTKTARIVVIR